MDSRIKRAAKPLLVALMLATAIGTTGCSRVLSGANSTQSTGTADKSSSQGVAGSAATPLTQSELSAAPPSSDAARSDAVPAASTTPDRLIVSNAAMSIQVKNVDAAVAAVRVLAASSNSQIVGLSVQAGGDQATPPQPLGDGTSAPVAGPGSAQITLRVPADKLSAVEAEAAKLGKVLSQTASENDVTQQHVDMAARLKNLQAEEARLREFLTKATNVTQMLEIERELSRVRGEIESMQAQLAYLEQQAAMATLTLALSSPGALVAPAGGTWGFSAAVRTGIQAAAGVISTLIVVVIALAPIALVVLLIVLLVRARRRRRPARTDAEEQPAVLVEDPTLPAE